MARGSRWQGYACALLVTLGVAILRSLLDPLLGSRYPLSLFYVAVAIAGWHWGVGPAVLAAIAGYLIGQQYFTVAHPGGALDLLDPTLYASIAAAVIALVHRVHDRQQQLDVALREQAEIRERLESERRDTHEARARLDAAHAATGMVEWQWDVATGRVEFSNSARHVFGTAWNNVEDAWPLAHPDDRERVESTIRQALAEGRDYAFVSRMIRPDTGATRWIETRAVVHRQRGGSISHVSGITIDITDKHDAIERAALAEQRFRVALDGTSIIAWACDSERCYTWVYNPGSPVAADALIGRPINTTFPRETYAAYADACDRVWETGRAERLPITWTHDGETRHYVSHIDAIKDPAGRVTGLVGASIDVTVLHRAQRAALDAQSELQTVMDTMAAGVCRCSRDLRYRWVSRRYLEWLGHPDEQVVGRPIVEVLGEPLFAAKRPYVERVLAGVAVEFEQEVPWPNGPSRWIHAAYTPTYDAAGSVDGWVAVITDRTERHRLDDALRESEERLRLALDGAEIGMWTSELDTGLTTCTPRNWALFGLSPDTPGPCTTDQWYAAIHPEDRVAIRDAWAAAVDGRAPYRAEYRIVRPDGEVRWVDSRGYFHRDAADRPVRVLGITMDITERKQADAALRDANQRKDEFLATLAHELRNPLAPIRYASRLFKASTPPEMIEDLGQMIERQLAHMARLLDDLLDVSRITRGSLTLRRETLDVRGVIEAAVDGARPLAEKVEHRLEVRLPAHALPVEGDATRLVQALGNLLNNATKYTDPGGVIVVEAHADATDVVVEVRDTGIGIPGEILPTIFDLFTQGDHHGRGSGGLGIGLSLARQLASLHGGQLDAHSDGPGRGSRFTLRLPRVAETPAVAGRVAAPDRVAVLGAAGTRVLIVDDNTDAADSLAQVLAFAGYQTKVAYDGMTALEIAEIIRPPIVLLDLGLPNLSGHEVARRLRAEPWGRAIQLVAVTGWGQESDRRKSRESGFAEHLTKPVDPDLLLQLLARLTRGIA